MTGLPKRSPQERTGDGRVDAAMKSKRSVGAGVQALAWGVVSFTKSPAGGSTSASTSPETDPGDSAVFPFFKEEDLEDECGDEEEQDRVRQNTMRSNASREKDKDSRHQDFQNPLFHMPLESDSAREVEQTKATASMFPGDDTPRAPMRGSNPMFSRTKAADGSAAPKQKSRRKESSSGGSKSNKSASSEGGSEGGSGGRKTRKSSKDKAVYEHVGRTEFRPKEPPQASKTQPESKPSGSKPSGGKPSGNKQETPCAFRVDSFARNEGEDGATAHFKFVFTLEAADGTKSHRVRPVLDAIHERDTGKIRVAVNDGRVASATRTAVEVVLPNIGAVLFNPRMQAKGHHLYTLSLGACTLFSVLA